MKRLLLSVVCVALSLMLAMPALAQTNYDYSQIQREKLGRGLVAVRSSVFNAFVSWRYLSTDPMDIKFHLYANDSLVNVTSKTSAQVKKVKTNETHFRLVPVIDGVEQADMAATYTLPANTSIGYINIPMNVVPDTTVAGTKVTYSPNDASVGDVDGDGEYEIFLKWDPSNSQDNSISGYTGNVYIDCYKIDGTFLWRINLGRNIRAGAHYTQFMVYDFDGDGKAEMICKTADGTVDGVGTVIGDAAKDYRNSSGYVLSGPEYLTVFNGETGAAMQTVNYLPARGTVSSWGDNYGNRVDRYLACVAWLDGVRPSAVMCRGYYTRTVLVAWDWDGTNLTRKWTFDTNNGYSSLTGQGNHNLRVGDVDSDGCDEIVYGSMTIDHTGKPKYNTKYGHGDAMHMTVFDPASGELAVWACHEDKVNGSTFRKAKNGLLIKQIKSSDDVGRCMAADIDPNYPGVEMWSARSGGILATDGTVTTTSTKGVSMNMACWWDGKLLRNLQDGVSITRYDYSSRNSASTLLSASDCSSNNSTKNNPCLVADMFGDWREELLVRTSDNKNLRLYINTDTISYRFHTFLEDPVYRSSVAYQNVAYNQPTNTGFYFGADLGKGLKTVGETFEAWTLDAGMNYDTYEWRLGDTLVIGNERTVDVSAYDIPEGSRAFVYLYSTFRGYTFRQGLTLARPAGFNPPVADIYVPAVVGNTLDIDLSAIPTASLAVYSTNGALLHALPAVPADGSVSISTDSWPQGLYIVRISTPTTVITRKVMVQ